ncbi:MAG: hypothetical protein R3B99_23210 [Polyangiales bacterium]
MSAGWVRGLFGLTMCLCLPSVVRADVGLVWPACEPAWWERDAVQRVVAVELRASGAAERRGELRFAIDVPCDDAHEVGLTWRDDQGVARRSLDLRDVPAAARARAIALAVAGLVAGPRVAPEVEAPSESNEAASNEAASNEAASNEAASNEAASNEASNEAASASNEVESPSALPPPVPGDAAGSRAEGDTPEAPDAPDPLAPIENPEESERASSVARATDAWQLGATFDGAWSTSATPWLGGGIVAGWARGLGAIDLRVAVRFGRERVALGTLVGRWGGATVRGGVDWRAGRTRLGARFGLGVDAIVLFGRSDTSPTARRIRWTPVAELVGRVAIGERGRAVVELGAVTPLLGLRATAPDGAIEVRHVVGVLRVGVDFDVAR